MNPYFNMWCHVGQDTQERETVKRHDLTAETDRDSDGYRSKPLNAEILKKTITEARHGND
jgi:hypothetical protein